jgi:hypothetical protein
MKETLFKEYPDRDGLGFFLSIVLIFTPFLFCYERFFQRSYFKNRKALIKALKSGKCELVSTRAMPFDSNIIEYIIRYNGEEIRVWHWHQHNSITALSGRSEGIGLFIGSLEGRMQTNKIIKLITNLK